MKKAKRAASFLGGILTVLLVFGCFTTALAASGQITYNFANVSLNGEQKIAAGTEITAANGQKVPSSILYTDAAGGKTNYLPIRAISELLGGRSDTIPLQKPFSWEPAGATGWPTDIPAI